MRFVLVDRILELEPGRRIKASKRLPAGEELFRDHFPGFPVVPGVLLTEMMAQAAGKCLDSEGTHPGRAMLGTIREASFRSWVRPDEEITIYAEIIQNRDSYAKASAYLEVNGRKVCSGELFFVFAPSEQFAPDYRDEVLEAYLKSSGPGSGGTGSGGTGL
jgi:3-hydroxyacyl-[acyl-carrier-protein] dehydratase